MVKIVSDYEETSNSLNIIFDFILSSKRSDGPKLQVPEFLFINNKKTCFPEFLFINNKKTCFPEFLFINNKKTCFPEFLFINNKKTCFPEFLFISNKKTCFPEFLFISNKKMCFPEFLFINKKKTCFPECVQKLFTEFWQLIVTSISTRYNYCLQSSFSIFFSCFLCFEFICYEYFYFLTPRYCIISVRRIFISHFSYVCFHTECT